MRVAFLLSVVATLIGCNSKPSPAADPAPTSAMPAVLTRVGAHPRGFLRGSFERAELRTKLDALTAKLSGHSLAQCAIDPDRLRSVQLAIGEPLRVAAEIEGAIDAHAIACLVGEHAMQALTARGVALRDHPGGVTIEYRPEVAPASAAATDLVARCRGARCVVATLGPQNRPLRLDVSSDKKFHLELGGPALGHGAEAAVAAIDRIRADNPALKTLLASDQHGTFVAELASTDIVQALTIALVIRKNLLESVNVSTSSMVPTLQVNDRVLVAKGSLAGTPEPGDLVFHTIGDARYIKRYLAGPGQHIHEVDDDFTLDDKRLATEVVQRNYRYADRDPDTNAWSERAGTLVREHLGARSYLTVRIGPADSGDWQVEDDHVFLVGDNRNNSNDSRFRGSVPKADVLGRVLTVWFAARDGAPDWDRVGVPLD